MFFFQHNPSEAFQRDDHGFAHIISFAIQYNKIRRSAKKAQLNLTDQTLFDSVAGKCLEWIAGGLDAHITQSYITNFNVDRPPPSKKNASAKSGGKRSYVQISLDGIWTFIEQSRSTAASLRQVLQVRRSDVDAGASERNADDWLGRTQHLYRGIRRMCFDRCQHFNVVADPSHHAKKEIMASAVYCWQNDAAAMGDIQRVLPGRHVLENEADVSDVVARLAAEGRLERVATYRHIQAVSNTVKLLDQPDFQSVEDFLVPEEIVTRPVNLGEQYVVRPVGGDDGIDEAFLYTPETKQLARVLPENWTGTLLPLIVLCLDQGSPGVAGQAYFNHMRAMIHSKWDCVHRCIRDVRGAIERSCDALFLKAQVYSGYVMALNVRPFNSGAHGDLKRRLLNVFYACETIDGHYFLKYGSRIAADMGKPFETLDDKIAVWENMARLSSFNAALETPKLARWFSWNASEHAQTQEWYTLKMILEFHCDGIPSSQSPMDADAEGALPFDHKCLTATKKNDPRAQLQLMRSSAGGLPLCYSLMSAALLAYTKALAVITKAVWTWYKDRITTVTTPLDNLRLTLTYAGGKWLGEAHFRETIRGALFDPGNLRYVRVLEGDSTEQGRLLVERMHEGALAVVGQRAWSFAVRYGSPPETFVGMLSSSAHDTLAASTLMKSNWRRVLKLEQLRHEVCDAKTLWQAVAPVVGHMPVRMLFILYERDRFKHDSVAGKRLLYGLLKVFADNKIVEDIHGKLRLAAKANANTLMTYSHMQDVVNASGVLEARKIEHRAVVTKSIFLRKFKAVKNTSRRGDHEANRHKLSRKWSMVMSRKTWPTIAEDILRQAAAAWEWLQNGCAGLPVEKIGVGRFSSLLGFGLLIDYAGIKMFSLGQFKWAALCWPLERKGVDDYALRYDSEAAAMWKHVVDPNDW